MMKNRFIYLCFFLSGVAGLMYELIWTRFFSLTFGATTYSITTVLTAFMAGLAFGSLILGRVADRIENRLALYGWIELLIGLYALLFPFLFKLSSGVYLHWVGLGEMDPTLKLSIKFVLSFLIMLVPTTLMGGSLPILSRYLIKDLKGVSSRLGTLYAINTFGAVIGTFLTGFYLLYTIGLNASILAAAMINIGIGIGMILYSRKPGEAKGFSEGEGPSPAKVTLTNQERTVIYFAVTAFMISGFVSLSHEVVWTRILALIIGSSTYAFTMILIGFLIGIALGSYILSHTRLIPSDRINIMTFAWIEIGIGISAYALIPLFSKLPNIMLKAFQINPDSYNFITFYQFLVVLVIVIVPTTLMGATLPVIGKIVSKEVRSVGGAIGNIYFFNTFGAIFGSFLAGFFFIPYLGTLTTLKFGISINIFLGIGGLLLVFYQRKQGAAILASLLVASAGLTGIWFSTWDENLMDRGVSIYGPMLAHQIKKEGRLRDNSKVLYMAEGINATISVRRSGGKLFLKTNGKVDASTIEPDMATQTFLGYLPMMLHPDPHNALIIGLGSGVTAWTVAQYDTIQSLDIVEIEPSLVEAASFFQEVNHNVTGLTKTHLIINDGRNHLLETKEKYDLIISEPSNPWISGVGSLFTKDFFQTAKKKLNDRGIFCQWIHYYSMSSANLKMVLKTIAISFEHVQLWNSPRGDLLVIASDTDIQLNPMRFDQVVSYDSNTIEDFSRYLLAEYPMELLGRLLLDRSGIMSFSNEAQINSDNYPYLEFLAPKDLYRSGDGLSIYQELLEWGEKEEPLPLKELRNVNVTDVALAYFHRSKIFAESDIRWFEKGEQYIEKALALDDSREDFYFHFGKMLFHEKKYVEAKDAIIRGLKIKKTSTGIRLMAHLLKSTGEDGQALELLAQNKDLLKDYEKIYGEALLETGRYEQAIPYLEESLNKRQEKEYRLMEKLGICYQAIGQLEAAERYYLQSIQKEEMNPRSQFYLAKLYGEQERNEEAQRIYGFLKRHWDEDQLRNISNKFKKLKNLDPTERPK